MDNSSNFETKKPAKMIILNCTYEEKNTVQKLGAKWNNSWRAWCIDDTMDFSLFAKWLPKG